MKRIKIIAIVGLLTGLVLLIVYPGRQLARAHVNERTGVNDHPLLCTSCHINIAKNKVISGLINADYFSPFNMAVNHDGNRLFVIAQDADELLIVDLDQNKVINTIPVGEHPHSVIIDKAQKRAYVSNEWSDNVSVIDLASSRVTDTLHTGNGPAGLAFSADEKFLYAVNAFGSDVSVIELATKKERKRLGTGNNPTGIALSPDGKQLCVTSRRVNIAPYDETLISELTIIEDASQRAAKINVESAYLMENVAFTPQGDLAMVTLIRPKNQVPSIQVEHGWMMTHGIGIIQPEKDGRVMQLLLDEPNAFYPDPFDIVITPDGKKAFVSSSGVDQISVLSIDSIRQIIKETSPEMLKIIANDLSISGRIVIKRIPTGANPKGLTLSADGKKLYVAEQLEDRIGIISTESLTMVGSIDLGGTHRITVARQGRRLFNNAGHTFQNQYSCYTCHPDTHEDGLIYNMAGKDMGRNLTNTQSLREIGDTAPFKWNGKNQTVYKQDGIRFSTVLTRTEQFSYDDLDAITAYIMRGIKQPPNLMHNPEGVLTESQLRGKILFERSEDNDGNPIPENNRCVTCHPAPLYSNLALADVSTLAESDDPILFDTPHLTNVFASPPYLHDGRAQTLEEIWTIYGLDDKHGHVNDMSKTQLNDLVDYLNSLRSEEYADKITEVQQGSILHSN
jgi:YVTN family beta-propeller protein